MYEVDRWGMAQRNANMSTHPYPRCTISNVSVLLQMFHPFALIFSWSISKMEKATEAWQWQPFVTQLPAWKYWFEAIV